MAKPRKSQPSGFMGTVALNFESKNFTNYNDVVELAKEGVEQLEALGFKNVQYTISSYTR